MRSLEAEVEARDDGVEGDADGGWQSEVATTEFDGVSGVGESSESGAVLTTLNLAMEATERLHRWRRRWLRMRRRLRRPLQLEADIAMKHRRRRRTERR